MTALLIPKAPIGKKYDSLPIILTGNHTFKQKIAMLLDAKYLLQHNHNIKNVGVTRIYMNFVDDFGHQLTHFPDGTEIAGYELKVDSAYHCAADAYERMTFPSSSS